MGWETVASILGGVVLLGAFVKASVYLWERGRSRGQAVVRWWDERRRQRKAFAALVQEEGWPNGSKSLPDSLGELYDRTDKMWTVLSHIWRIVEPNHVEASRLSRPDEPYGTPNGW